MSLTICRLFILSIRVGRNVAAGMTGGLAYILDDDDTLIPKVCRTYYFFEMLIFGYLMHIANQRLPCGILLLDNEMIRCIIYDRLIKRL